MRRQRREADAAAENSPDGTRTHAERMTAMRTVPIEELTPEAFKPFGRYAAMLAPDGECIGEDPIRFYRDMLPLPNGEPRSLPSFSICQVRPRPLVVDVSEIHSYAFEGNLPLDADALIHVAPATANGVHPFDRIRVFRIPRGTFVVVNPGVWHHAPFVYGKGNAVLNMLIVLPERAYANDCIVVPLKEEERVGIREGRA